MTFNFGPKSTSSTGFNFGTGVTTPAVSFSFGPSTVAQQPSFSFNPPASQTSASGGFSFGGSLPAQSSTNVPGFSFGEAKPATANNFLAGNSTESSKQPAFSGFSFNISTATTKPTNHVTFGTTSSGSSSLGFTALNNNTTMPASTTGGFSVPMSTTRFSLPASTTGFSLPASNAGFSLPASTAGFSLPASTAGFSLPASTAGFSLPASTTGFSVGISSQPVGFNFGVPNPSATTSASLFGSFNLSTSKATSSASTDLSASAPPSKSLFSGVTASSASSATGIGLSTTNTLPLFGGLSSATTFGSIAASSTTSVPIFGTSATSAPTFALNTTTSSVGLTFVPPPTASAASTKQMSFKELEETVDKWLHDLGEQEKSFLNQAAQVNMWDKQLIDNGEKITALHNEVERVKAEQQRLDRELDFILSQQEELEEILLPIEEQIKLQPVNQSSQHTDIEREQTYRLAESIDSQLKRMMQDLGDVIDHINMSNIDPAKGRDESMTQIAKILNAHMDSLQWLEQNTNQLQRRVDEVNQALDTRKREHERTFRYE